MVNNTIPPPMYSPGQATPDWRSWFAWYPVKVKGQWQWMKKVYRSRLPSIFARRTPWIYGDLFDVLTAEPPVFGGQIPPKPPPAPPPRILNF